MVGTALQCGHVVDMGNFGRSLHQSGVGMRHPCHLLVEVPDGDGKAKAAFSCSALQGLWAARPGHQKQKMGDCKVKVNIFLLGHIEYPKDYRTFKGFLIY